MSYPPYSYLTPATLGTALDLARQLHRASEEVSDLGFGVGGAIAMGISGRAGDRAVAVRDWIGPHKDTFERLMDNEFDSLRTTRLRLVDEADAWARFWARATNARNNRLHDQAMNVFDQSMDAYAERATEYRDAIAEDPEIGIYLSAPSPPRAPVRPSYVPPPTAESNYQPTN